MPRNVQVGGAPRPFLLRPSREPETRTVACGDCGGTADIVIGPHGHLLGIVAVRPGRRVPAAVSAH
ncbi:MAG TPA: hypothetical protein VMH78_08855 [Thermoplasmata archaeon]|nr:hypothetical protein [Thermoplasmata archaeon]